MYNEMEQILVLRDGRCQEAQPPACHPTIHATCALLAGLAVQMYKHAQSGASVGNLDNSHLNPRALQGVQTIVFE